MALSRTRAASCAACLLALATVGGVSRADCTKDIECKADRICERGRCVAPPPSAPSTTAETPPPTPASTASAAPGAPRPLPEPSPPLPKIEPPPKPAPPPQDERDKVEVTFAPAGSQDDDDLSLEDEEGRKFACHAPCTLRLVPGHYYLESLGTTAIAQDIAIPEGGAKVTLRRAFAGSYTLMEMGGAVALLGWAVGLTGFVWDNVNPSSADPTAPIALFVAGSVAAIGGTVLIFASGPRGSDRAEVSPRRGRSRAEGPARPFAVRFLGLGVQGTAERTRVPALTFQFQ